MTGMGYDSSGMRAGAQGCHEAAAAARQVAELLASAQLTGDVFGRVSAAAGFTAALEGARLRHARAAAGEGVARVGLAVRVRDAAARGDGVTAATTAIALSVSRRAVLAGMQG